VAARLHRPAARRRTQPRLLHGRRLELRPDRRRRAYAELAADWRAEGAQIIGGCCGCRPEHIAAARERVRDSRSAGAHAQHRRRAEPAAGGWPARRRGRDRAAPWLDDAGRRLYPARLPEIVCEPGVFVPTQGSFLCGSTSSSERIGEGQRCLDIGCGTGLLAIQLARNGAEHVHAIDIDRRAVANTLSNAFRNGVADR
jgi:predicted O-methyltransferase YrrM